MLQTKRKGSEELQDKEDIELLKFGTAAAMGGAEENTYSKFLAY